MKLGSCYMPVGRRHCAGAGAGGFLFFSCRGLNLKVQVGEGDAGGNLELDGVGISSAFFCLFARMPATVWVAALRFFEMALSVTMSLPRPRTRFLIYSKTELKAVSSKKSGCNKATMGYFLLSMSFFFILFCTFFVGNVANTRRVFCFVILQPRPFIRSRNWAPKPNAGFHCLLSAAEVR